MKKYFLFFSHIGVLACTGGEHVIDKQINKAPSILIVSHSNGAELLDGYTEYFRATVSDDDNKFEELEITWYVGEDIVCEPTIASAAGESLCEIVFSEGDQNVIAEVRDDQGMGGRAEIEVSVTPTEAPVIELLAPIENERYYADQLIQFSAMVSDAEDVVEDLTLSWTSSLDGVLSLDTSIDSNGEMSDFSYLSEGNHAIELRATDSSGKYTTAEVVLQVSGDNNIPSCEITEPLDGTMVMLDEAVIFRAVVNDLDIPSNQLSVEWTSNRDGVFDTTPPASSGDVSFIYDGLSLNNHTISLNVSDEVGAVCTSQILLSVGNTPPVVDSITFSPDPVFEDTDLTAIPSLSDVDGQVVTASFVWYENGILTSFTSPTIPASELAVGEEWMVRVTPNDGYYDGSFLEQSITVSNSAPTIANVSITSTGTIYNDSILSCSATVTDINQSITPVFSWDINGSIYNGDTLDLSTTSAMPDDTISCSVMATDNQGLSTTASTTTTVENRPPVMGAITLLPNSGIVSNSNIICSSSATDPDGEIPTIAYDWKNGSNIIGSSQNISLDNTLVSPLDTVECVATATDGHSGTSSVSSYVIINNSDPTVDSLTISPSYPLANDTLLCEVTTSDIDGGTPIASFEFWNTTNNTSYPATTSSNTSASLDLNTLSTAPNDVFECRVSIVDSDGGSNSAITTVSIANEPPTINSIAISPNTGIKTGTMISCTATASDPDDGDLSNQVNLSWEVAGNVVSNQASYTVSASDSDVGDSIFCIASVTDSNNQTSSDSTSVVVENTIPAISTLSISPTVGFNDTVFNCSATVVDPDETPTLSYTWSDGTINLDTGNSFDASTTALLPGDSLYCAVTADDGNGGIASADTSISLDNRAPSAPTISISWTANGTDPVESDDLLCSASGSSDPDGQALSYTYSWTSSSGASISGDTVLASETNSLETWTCAAVASDGSLSSNSTTASATIAVPDGCGLTNCDFNLDIGNGLSIDFVLLSAGSFSMGSPSSEVGRGSDEVQHPVTLTNDFYVMTTETTQGMFNQLMGYQAYQNLSTSDSNGTLGVGTSYPAYYVNWHMAADFANKVTQQHNAINGTALQECYSCSGSGLGVSCSHLVDPYQCSGYRLLTEAEWEYAARAGSTDAIWTPNGGANIPSGSETAAGCNLNWILSDGSSLGDLVWFCGNHGSYNASYSYGAREVATKAANSYALYDMNGNLWEWVHDFYGSYSTNSVTNPVDSSGFDNIIRGGGAGYSSGALRSAKRTGENPSNRLSDLGFRLGRIP